MTTSGERVFLEFNPNAGSRLEAHARLGPVWVIDSPANRAAAQSRWEATPRWADVTVFDDCSGVPDPDACVEAMETIEEHHPHWRVVEVRGMPLREPVAVALSVMGDVRVGSGEGADAFFTIHRSMAGSRR